MKAVVLREFGPPGVLRWEEVPAPQPALGEAIVQIEFGSVNRLDLLLRSSRSGFHLELPRILGCEGAGRVLAVGPEVNNIAEGDRVAVIPWRRCGECRWCRSGQENLCTGSTLIGIDFDGCYADLVAAPAGNLMKLDHDLTLEVAAAAPVICGTALHAIHIAQPQSGETALVMAAASGVGAMLVQLLRGIGLRVIAAAGEDSKLARLTGLGADETINYRRGDWVEDIRGRTGGYGVDLVMEQIGGDMMEQAVGALIKGGRLVTYGASGSTEANVGDLHYFYRNQLTVRGSMSATRAEVNEMFERIRDGQLRVPIDKVFALEEAAQAHEYMEARRNFGKVLLRL